MTAAVIVVQQETIVAERQETIVAERQETAVVAVCAQGPAGAPAPVVAVGGISNDAGNAITHGTDGGLYTPDDIPTDPLAYYILARS